ncbi:MAG: hypothetical protein WC488_01090 [Candidatus Micrarchaeia archaeon]
MSRQEFEAWKDCMPGDSGEALRKNLDTFRHILALVYTSTQTKTNNVNQVRANPGLLTLRKKVNLDVPAPRQVFTDALHSTTAQSVLFDALTAAIKSTRNKTFRNEDFAANLRIISNDCAASLALVAKMEEHFERYGMDDLDPKFRGKTLFGEQVLALMEAMTRLDFSGREWVEVSRLLSRDEEKTAASASVLSHTIGGVGAQYAPALHKILEEFRMNPIRGEGLFCDLLCEIVVQSGWAEESVTTALAIANEVTKRRKHAENLDVVGTAADLFALIMAEEYKIEEK